MSKVKRIDGATIEIGYHLDGYGKRIYINGNDVTDTVRKDMGKSIDCQYVPDGCEFICSHIAKRLVDGEFKPNKIPMSYGATQ